MYPTGFLRKVTCRDSGCKSIGTLQDVEKKVLLYISIGTV